MYVYIQIYICLESVWKVLRKCPAQKSMFLYMSGKCLECVWKVSSSEKHIYIHIYICLESVWNVSGKCLVLKSTFLIYVQKVSGMCMESV